uniref:Uncharacterized protein n=1 Tax=Eutreptiella gymnastica TaxID=73025 RepID=A0A7S4CJH5_9EUGL
MQVELDCIFFTPPPPSKQWDNIPFHHRTATPTLHLPTNDLDRADTKDMALDTDCTLWNIPIEYFGGALHLLLNAERLHYQCPGKPFASFTRPFAATHQRRSSCLSLSVISS